MGSKSTPQEGSQTGPVVPRQIRSYPRSDDRSLVTSLNEIRAAETTRPKHSGTPSITNKPKPILAPDHASGGHSISDGDNRTGDRQLRHDT